MSKVNFKVKEIGELVLFTPQNEDATNWWLNNVPEEFYIKDSFSNNLLSRRHYGGFHTFGKSFVAPIKHARKIWSDICTANGSHGWSVA